MESKISIAAVLTRGFRPGEKKSAIAGQLKEPVIASNSLNIPILHIPV
jgi:hypothetical protein